MDSERRIGMADWGERREKKPFEPPPWERDAFEKIADRRGQTDALSEVPDEEPAVKPPPKTDAAGESVGPKPEKTADGPMCGGDDGEPALPDGFDLMMEGLRGAEAEAGETLDRAGAWVAMAVAVFGVVMFVWGMVGMFRGGGKLTAIAMGIALMGVGGLFAGAGVWSATKNLKRQGVL